MNIKDWIEFNKCISGPFWVTIMRKPSMKSDDIALEGKIDKVDLVQLFNEYAILKIVPSVYDGIAYIKFYIFKEKK